MKSIEDTLIDFMTAVQQEPEWKPAPIIVSPAQFQRFMDAGLVPDDGSPIVCECGATLSRCPGPRSNTLAAHRRTHQMPVIEAVRQWIPE